MGNRLELHDVFLSIVENVYFQPPESVKIAYPCIIYERSSSETYFANNSPYVHTLRYKVTVIDSNPDSDIPKKIAMLPMCVFDRHYTVDNFNYDVYNLYF